MIHQMSHMTWKQLSKVDPEKMILILPIGSMEQHSTHLPVGTDTLILSHMLDAVRNDPRMGDCFFQLPPISYGCSHEHMAFPGTFTLSCDTVVRILEDVLADMDAHGWHKLVIMNSHGGNTHLFSAYASTWKAKYQVCIRNIDFWVSNFFADGASLIQTPLQYDIHAGEIETSYFEYIFPKLVDMDELAKLQDVIVPMKPCCGAWFANEISESGLYGGATKSTPETGRKIFDYMCEKLVSLLADIRREEIIGKGDRK